MNQLYTLPAIRMIASRTSRKVLQTKGPASAKKAFSQRERLRSVLFIEQTEDTAIIKAVEKADSFQAIAIKDTLLIGISDCAACAEKILEQVENGENPAPEACECACHQSVSCRLPHPGIHKIAIVTGGAQGFGGGIVEEMYKDGVNVVIADMNEEKSLALIDKIQDNKASNQVVFIKCNVADAESVSALIEETVKKFGGLDIFLSNAGVLRAGGLDEMTPETFDFMTNVNYKGYFICAKYASEVMKTQHTYNSTYSCDIIQINSKSGLKGSNKNFAYAGGKFGGIGLTQSFALELMPFNIKVNAICPGNFFEGPLWADPENGLFVQYLKAGKVPGAKTLEEVKHFYESQVPAGRGCRVNDVLKAIYYVIEQEYETGQAIPVTGGQNMLH